MILSDLPEFKEGPPKSVISFYYSAWNLSEKSYMQPSAECVSGWGIYSWEHSGLCLLLCEAGCPETSGNLPRPHPANLEEQLRTFNPFCKWLPGILMVLIGMQISELWENMKDVFRVGSKAFEWINDYGFFFSCPPFFLVLLYYYFRK